MDEKKSIIQDFKEKTAGMGFTGKLDYFWTYYKIHTIVVAFTLIVITSIASGMIKNSLTHPVLNVGVISDIDLYYHDDLQNSVQHAFPENTGFHKPLVTSFYSPSNTAVMYASTQLMAYLSADQLDCMICDRATLDYCQNSDLPLGYEDISSSPIGQTAKSLGIPNLYYVWLTDSPNVDAAVKYLPAVKTLKLD